MDKQSNALITFNDEPEDAISALNGAACLLKMLRIQPIRALAHTSILAMLTIRWALLLKPQHTS